MKREQERPEAWLAAGFAEHVGRWALQRGASPPSAQAAAVAAQALSLAVSAGHTCLDVQALPCTAPTSAHQGSWRELLLGSGVVASAGSATGLPMVLDASDRLYLLRHFDDEARLALRVAQVAAAPARVDADAGEGAGPMPQPPPAAPDDVQAQAVDASLRRGLSLISGGPGTGKTTLVTQILARLLQEPQPQRLVLAAPTGKAAARLLESLGQRASTLPLAVRERLPTEAFTLHRLLGSQPGGGFRHGPHHPLPLDVLIVDEASMLDLSLARHLFEALPASARIVLLGDPNQLAAVEAGAVFSELCTAAQASGEEAASRAGPLAGCLSVLEHSHRFDRNSGLGRLAGLVKTGRAQEALQCLREPEDGAVEWIDDAGTAPAEAVSSRMLRALEPYIQAVLRDPCDVAGISQAFDRFRVLCLHRSGPRGVDSLNQWLGAHLRRRLQALDADPGGPWFTGRPVLVTHNDATLGLYNGDTGIALPDAQGRLRVHVARPGQAFQAVPAARLPAHESALAMTVHKAQGSEFDEVMLLLPSGSPGMLSREAVYTAITRARQRVCVCGEDQVLLEAVERRTVRRSGLREQLTQAL